MNSREIPDYKRKIMLYLLSDAEICNLVDYDQYYEYPDDMIYEKLFPYNRVPETEQEVSVYIAVMVDVPDIYKKNDTIRNIKLRIRVYCHADIMRVKNESGTRIDLIAARIDELLNESYDFGIGYVQLGSNTEHVLDSKHHYRELVFKTDALNNRRTGDNQWMT